MLGLVHRRSFDGGEPLVGAECSFEALNRRLMRVGEPGSEIDLEVWQKYYKETAEKQAGELAEKLGNEK